MNFQDHIDQLISQAKDDYGAAEALASATYFGHALFWAHLSLEKYCKALWVYKNQNTNYPYIHNLLRLLKESGEELNENQIQFYSAMNQFQSQGRYIDALQKMEATVTKDICYDYLDNSKTQLEWILNLMQKK